MVITRGNVKKKKTEKKTYIRIFTDKRELSGSLNLHRRCCALNKQNVKTPISSSIPLGHVIRNTFKRGKYSTIRLAINEKNRIKIVKNKMRNTREN